jgi:HlyD family secretion protein
MIKTGWWLLICVVILSACNKGKEIVIPESGTDVNAAENIIGIGKIVPEENIIQVAAAVNGIVTVLHKKENDTVAIGSVILELEHAVEDEKVLQCKQQIATQYAQITMEAADITEIKARLNYAEQQLKHTQNLFDKGAETKQNVLIATTDLQSIQAMLQKQIAAEQFAKSKLRELEANLSLAQIERSQKIITSPVKGRILEMDVFIGSAVTMLQPFAQIAPEGKIIAICEIDELSAPLIKVGQQVWIRNSGSLDTLTTGQVFFVYSFLNKKSLFTDQSGEKEDRRVLTIKIALNKQDDLLINARVECVLNVKSTLVN